MIVCFKIRCGINVDAATSQNKHNKAACSTKSTEIPSPNRTETDRAQATGHDSCLKNDKPAVPASATTKATAVPTFKLTLSGQVI